MTKLDEFFGNYLKTEHITGEVIYTIKEVVPEKIGRENNKETKAVAHFEGVDKGLALNKVNAEAIAEISGSREIEDWVGTKVCLYVDPDVEFAGKKVGGIRIKKVPSSGVKSKEMKPGNAEDPAAAMKKFAE